MNMVKQNSFNICSNVFLGGSIISHGGKTSLDMDVF